MYDFAKEMNFDVKAPGNKNNGDRTLTKMIKSPAIMVSGNSTVVLPSDHNEVCDSLKLLLQKSNNSNLINDGIIAIVEKLLK